MKIARTGDRGVFAPPVSYAQEWLWFLEQLEPGTPLYNIPYIATVTGAVRRSAFDAAVNRLIARHESLRTCFVESGGTPRQAIYPELTVEVDWQDLSALDARSRAGRLQAICSEVTSTPFELGKAPLFRIMLVASPRETTIITAIHHIIADGWSLGVFQRELSALYQEELGGRPAALPALRIQYADHAVWQRDQLQGDRLARLRAYWTRQLDGATPILELPGDRPRPAKQTFSGAVHLFDLSAAQAAGIKALGRREDATLFMSLFAVFAVLLYRLTGHRDVLVGTPIAGRKGADVEHLIGLFVNTLVLRVRMAPDQSFLDVLADVKAMTLGAFEHQDLPFEKLVLELNPRRDLSHSPLIQVLFTLQNIPPLQALMSAEPTRATEVSRGLDGHTGTAKFDFALFVSEVGDTLQCSIEFNTDLFSPEAIADIAGHFMTLLDGILADPAARIAAVPVLTAAERRRRLDDSAGRDTADSQALGCHQLFERQRQRTPDAIAVAHASAGTSERLTYAELDAWANQIARHLIAHGVRPGDHVGICVPRSVRQIAAVLAIVKAGAAYLPLDPDHPLDRLRFMLDDARARLVVSSVDTRVHLGDDLDVVVLERDAPTIRDQPCDDLATAGSPDTPLYVMYTSGSTGRPKGVVMPHRAIVNLVEWQARASRASGAPRDAVTLQYAPLSFDVASQEIFSTLTSGGCLQVIDDHVRRDGARLLAVLAAQRVGRLFLPPVALEQLAAAAADTDLALDALREVNVAGDQLQISDAIRRWFGRLPHTRLVNQYGPTESHVVSAHALDGPASAWPTHPPIGTPIDNVQLHVLDDQLEPAPTQVAGELYIGGVAVALGYLGAAEDTRARFLRDPFRAGGALLYRTGDLCRYERDGALSFLGRVDHQIKLRGFRIEPGEVEAVLKQHPGVTEAVVVRRRSRQGDDQLVAYLVVAEPLGLDKAALRGHLAAKLPAYMIPAQLVRLDRLPLTGSGKIDRRALPDPAETAVAQDHAPARIAPRTPVEQFLAGCWCDVLQLAQVSVGDNFFELGGHSLTATQLVSRIRDHFGLELPLYRVFERPTLEALALEIIQRRASQQDRPDVEALLAELEALSDEDSEALLSHAAPVIQP